MPDYTAVPPPLPSSYAAPLVGMALGDRLAQLPQDYFEGQQRRRQLQLQQPILDPNTGQPTTDPSLILQEANRRGGLDYAVKLFPFLQRSDMFNRLMQDEDTAPAPPAQRPNLPGAGAANLTPSRPSTPGQVAAPGSYPVEGEHSIQSIATEVFRGRDVPDVIDRYAKALNVEASAPLPADKAEQVRQMMSRTAQAMPAQSPAAASPQQPQMTFGLSKDDSGPLKTTDASAQNGAAAAPRPSGGVGGGPGPAPSAAKETDAPSAGIKPNGPPEPSTGAGGAGAPPPFLAPQKTGGPLAAGAAPPAGSSPFPPPAGQGAAQPSLPRSSPSADAAVPPSYKGRALDYAQEQGRIGDQFAKKAEAAGFVGLKGEGFLAQAKDAYGRRDKIIDLLAKDAERSPEGRKAVESGVPTPLAYEGRLETEKESAKYWAGEFKAIDTSARESVQLEQKVQFAKNLANDPNFYSGAPAPDFVNQVKAAAANLGAADPNAAVRPEVFNKLTKDILTAQIRSLAQSGVGRVLLSEVQNMRDSIASMHITPASNRANLEILTRVLRTQREVGQLARQYNGGKLDAGFGDVLDKYLETHPIFKPEELHHPELLGAPTMRAGIDKTGDEKRVWGLRSGDPYYTPKGTMRVVQ